MDEKKAQIKINEEYCKGCTLCINACPQHLIRTSKQVSKTSYHAAEFFDPDCKCTGCALCAIVCPDAAITVCRKRVGGKD
jgi:2-oxoglutarate ferredoxin oxidoreductase subunit delta